MPFFAPPPSSSTSSIAFPHLYNWNPGTQLINFRGAKAQVRNSVALSRCTIACYGDSTTAGWNGSQVIRNVTSMPARLAARLTQLSVPAQIGNFSGNGNYNSGDPRIVDVGTGSWSGPNVYGGQTKAATGSANGFDFTPGVIFDRVDVDIVDGSTANTFTISVDGGTAQTVTPTNTGTVKAFTLSLSGTASSVVNYRGGTNQTQIQGIRVWSSTNPAIEVSNGGRGTMDTQGGAIVPTGTNPLAGLLAIRPKLCIINFGINDANNGVTPSAFASNITTMVTNLQSIACDVIICATTPVANSTTQTILSGTYLTALQGVADAKNVPVLSWLDRYQSYTKTNSQFGMSDQVHPSSAMYDDEAAYLASLLASV